MVALHMIVLLQNLPSVSTVIDYTSKEIFPAAIYIIR